MDAQACSTYPSLRRLGVNDQHREEALSEADTGMASEGCPPSSPVLDTTASTTTACQQSPTEEFQPGHQMDSNDTVSDDIGSESELNPEWEVNADEDDRLLLKRAKLEVASSHSNEGVSVLVKEPQLETEAGCNEGESASTKEPQLETETSCSNEDIGESIKSERFESGIGDDSRDSVKKAISLDMENIGSNEDSSECSAKKPRLDAGDASEHSDRRRNKSTSAAVLLGLVKSRVRKLATERLATKSVSSDAFLSSSQTSASSLSATSSPKISTPPVVRSPRISQTGTQSDWIKPFELGWRREVVHRGISSKQPASSSSSSSKPTADIYYFSPSNVKLRSMPEIIDYLKRNDSPLSPACFTFAREPVYHEPNEVVRMAGVPNVAGRQRRAKALTAPAVDLSKSRASVSSSSSASDCHEPTTDSKQSTQQHLSVAMKTDTPAIEKTTLKSSSSEETTSQVVPSRGRGRPRKYPTVVESVLSRGRGRPRKYPDIVEPMVTKQQPPVSRIVMLPPIRTKNTAQSSDSGIVKAPVVVRIPPVVVVDPPAVSDKTSVLLDKSPAVVVSRSPFVPLARPVSVSSRVVVINTGSTAVAKTTTSSDAAMKSVIAPAASEKTNLPATTVTSSSSSRPNGSTTVVVIRSSASSSSSSSVTDTTSSPAASSMLKKSSGSVVMSVKNVVPVKYAVVKDQTGTTLTQRKFSPLIKPPPFKRREGSSMAVVPEKTGIMLQDSWKPPVTSASTSAGVWTQKVCGMECSGRLGVPPTLYCDMCMALFHPECVGFSYLGRHVGFLCRSCRQLTVELQTSKYVLSTKLPAVSSETHMLTSSHQASVVTSSQTTHSLLAQAVTTCEVSVSRSSVTGAGIISSLVTSSPLLVTSGSALSTEIPVRIRGANSVSSIPALASTASETNAAQMSSDLVEQAALTAASASETVRCMPEVSKEDTGTCRLQETLLESTKEAEVAVNVDNVMAVRDDVAELSEVAQAKTASAANDSKTVSAVDVHQMSPEQKEQRAAAAVTVANDDSDVQQTSSKPPEQTDVITSSSEAVTCSYSLEASVSSKLIETVDSSCVKTNSVVHHVSDEEATQESVVTNKDDKHDNSDMSHTTSGDVSEEKRAAETNEIAPPTNDADSDTSRASQKEIGTVPAESVSSDKDDASDDKPLEQKTETLKEQHLRQIMTLPSGLLSHVNPSLPISLTLTHYPYQITVPAADIYRSKSGLQLLLPADSLPLDYVDSRQLMCTLGHSDDVSQLQQISISLTLH